LIFESVEPFFEAVGVNYFIGVQEKNIFDVFFDFFVSQIASGADPILGSEYFAESQVTEEKSPAAPDSNGFSGVVFEF